METNQTERIYKTECKACMTQKIPTRTGNKPDATEQPHDGCLRKRRISNMESDLRNTLNKTGLKRKPF